MNGTEDFDQWIEDGRPLEATVKVCLSGDLHQRHLDKCEELAELLRSERLSMEDDRIPRLREEIEDLREKIDAKTRTLTVRALEPDVYYRLVIEHPPRDEDELDKRHGINYDTFTPAIVEKASDLSADQVAKLRRKVSLRQWSTLWQTARDLCTDEVDVPKSLPDFGQAATSANE